MNDKIKRIELELNGMRTREFEARKMAASIRVEIIIKEREHQEELDARVLRASEGVPETDKE